MSRYCPKCFRRYDDSLPHCPEDGVTLVNLDADEVLGSVIGGKYRIVSRVGAGGMGIVYLATQDIIGRKVALKVLKSESARDVNAVKRFISEAKAIVELRSPHTIRLLDFGVSDDGFLYYTMDLLQGQPLSDYLREKGRLALEEAIALVLQTCESLGEAHSKGIIHRDIKPDNLFLSPAPRWLHLTVLDFGIAKLLGSSTIETLTETGAVCGTPAYLSPEQILDQELTPAADLYALAVVFYEMVCGRPPFRSETPIATLLQHLNDPIPPLPQDLVTDEPGTKLEMFFRRALAKSPEQRFQTTGEMKRHLIGLTSREDTAGSAAMGDETVRIAPRPVAPDLVLPATQPDVARHPETTDVVNGRASEESETVDSEGMDEDDTVTQEVLSKRPTTEQGSFLEQVRRRRFLVPSLGLAAMALLLWFFVGVFENSGQSVMPGERSADSLDERTLLADVSSDLASPATREDPETIRPPGDQTLDVRQDMPQLQDSMVLAEPRDLSNERSRDWEDVAPEVPTSDLSDAGDESSPSDVNPGTDVAEKPDRFRAADQISTPEDVTERDILTPRDVSRVKDVISVQQHERHDISPKRKSPRRAPVKDRRAGSVKTKDNKKTSSQEAEQKGADSPQKETEKTTPHEETEKTTPQKTEGEKARGFPEFLKMTPPSHGQEER